jgi:hypothetical protein
MPRPKRPPLLPGVVVGNLTVTERHPDGSHLRCVCSCGKPVIRSELALLHARTNKTQSACKRCMLSRKKQLPPYGTKRAS